MWVLFFSLSELVRPMYSLTSQIHPRPHLLGQHFHSSGSCTSPLVRLMKIPNCEAHVHSSLVRLMKILNSQAHAHPYLSDPCTSSFIRPIQIHTHHAHHHLSSQCTSLIAMFVHIFTCQAHVCHHLSGPYSSPIVMLIHIPTYWAHLFPCQANAYPIIRPI